MSQQPDTPHEYRIQYVDQPGGPAREVRATVDFERKAITYELPDGCRATVDVVTARALHMILFQAVYSSLEPAGPYLRVERNIGGGWPTGTTGRCP